MLFNGYYVGNEVGIGTLVFMGTLHLAIIVWMGMQHWKIWTFFLVSSGSNGLRFGAC